MEPHRTSASMDARRQCARWIPDRAWIPVSLSQARPGSHGEPSHSRRSGALRPHRLLPRTRSFAASRCRATMALPALPPVPPQYGIARGIRPPPQGGPGRMGSLRGVPPPRPRSPNRAFPLRTAQEPHRKYAVETCCTTPGVYKTAVGRLWRSYRTPVDFWYYKSHGKVIFLTRNASHILTIRTKFDNSLP